MVDNDIVFTILPETIKEIILTKGNKVEEPRLRLTLNDSNLNKVCREKLLDKQCKFYMNGEELGFTNVNECSETWNIYFSSNEKALLFYSILNSSGQIKRAELIENELPYYFADNYFPDLDKLKSEGMPFDSLLSIVCKYILTTPNDSRCAIRNEMMNDINEIALEYLVDDSDTKYLSENDYVTVAIHDISTEALMYYITCMVKIKSENKSLQGKALKKQALSLVIDYFDKESNFINGSNIDQNERENILRQMIEIMNKSSLQPEVFSN